MIVNSPNIRRLCAGLCAACVLPLMFPSVLLSPAAAADADSDFMYATGLFRKQRWKYAADAFQSFLKDHPQHARAKLARLYLGLALNSLEDYAPARVQFETFIKDNPGSRNMADARYRVGECSYYLREYRTAIGQLSEYLQKHKGHNLNDWASLMLGESHNAVSDWDRAEAILGPLLQSEPNAKILSDTMFGLAVALQGRKQWADAVNMFRRVADQKSAGFSHRALARIGTIYFGTGEFEKSSAAYDELVANHADKPIAASASLQSGIAQFQLEQYKAALQRLAKVPAESEVSPWATMWRGLCHRELGQLKDARSALAKAFSKAGETSLAAEILFNRAQVEVLDNRRDIASQMFLDLADRWPEDSHVADSLFNAAELKMETGELAASRRILERLRSNESAAAQPRVELLHGRLLLNENRVPQAIQILRTVASAPHENDRDKLLRHYHLIRALHRGEEFAEALTVFDQIRPLVTKPDSSEFFGAIALASMSSLELKRYDDAQQFATTFLDLEQDSAKEADALAARAVASGFLSQFEITKTELARLVSEFPDNAQTWMAVLQSAEAAWQQEEFQTSAELFTLAAERKSDPKVHLSGLSGAAWSHHRLGQFDQSAKLFRQARIDYPDSSSATESAYMEALSTLEAGMANEAGTLFLEVYNTLSKQAGGEKVSPWFLDSGRMHARILGDAGKVDEADMMWEQLSKRFETAAELDEILDEWAYLNLQHQRFEQSDRIYSELLDKFPDSKFAGQARLSLAESEMQGNRLDTALREFTAIAMDPRYGDTEKEAALYHAIDIHAAQRDWADVIKYAGLFAENYSSSDLAPNVQLLYAEGQLDQKNLTEAKSVLLNLRKAILDGNLDSAAWTERIWVVLAEVALAQKKYTDVDVVAKELEQRNTSSRFLFQMRDVQGRRWKSQAEPDFARARDYFGQVIRAETGRGTETAARCQFLIAETLLLEGDYEAALKEYYRVYLSYAYDDWRARGLFQAAGCEVKLQQFTAAVRSYEDLIKDFPDSELAEKAKTRLKELAATKN